MWKQIILLTGIACVSGCASMSPMENKKSLLEYTYDYQVPNKSKLEIWKGARDYIAQAFVSGKSVVQSEDSDDGTIYGNGIATWDLVTNQCLTAYQLRFAAKDGKARLQLEIERGVPAGSQCVGWPLPSRSGHAEIVRQFSIISRGLGDALNGKGGDASLKDF